MFIKHLMLINFRNYKKLDIELSSGTNIFFGDNAQGKTNILEAIYYASLGKSHRTSKDRELINWNKQEAYIKIYVCKQRLDKKIEMKIFKQGKKGVNINSIKVNKISELIGTVNTVIFSPEDLKIVKESPVYRRRFLDIELCKLSKKYYYYLSQYKKVLSERNASMKKIRGNTDILDIYDKQLSHLGSLIISERLKYIEKLNEKGKLIHDEITSKTEHISFKYITSIKKFDCIEEDMMKLLKKNRTKDLENRNTSIGPHRDDFSIEINDIDTRCYGSQGQQRTSVLTIKFASLAIIKELTGEYPILLLDDVLSELDINRQRYILNSIKEVQTLITCTGIVDIKQYIDKSSKIFKVSEGNIEEIS